VHVVPHGVDPRLFRTDAARRSETRARLGLANAFVFMSVGAMTGNKGIDTLLRAFVRIAATSADARLVLKGADDLYASRDLLRAQLDTLPAADRETVAARVVYLGERQPARDIADLLRAADCYVSPYLAEGFNMPVLEAAACGVPVICTAGGATEDFVDPAFAWRIRSQHAQVRTEGGRVGFAMQPDAEHLVELMLRALDDPQRAHEMGAAGAAQVARDFTWDRVTDRLVKVLFPE
jgi:glycosyltransferase involved in cell wall biosynthesis